MNRFASVLMVCAGLAGCTQAPTPGSQETENEVRAAQNAMCRIENQARCAHVIENRILMSRFFAPETLGGLNESEKIRGRNITTRFVVEAVAAINQCQRVAENSIVILRDLKINGSTWDLKATTPANENSACFIVPTEEKS